MSAVEGAVVAGWPLALTIAAVLARERARGARRRGALNRALHELRRPLQALALAPDARHRNGGSANGSGPGKLELAQAALDDLDREINGAPGPVRLRPVPCRPWVEGSLGRWSAAAGRAGSPVELRWRAGHATVLADPRRLAQALDNMIVNAIEHGGPPIRVEGMLSPTRVRIAVIDGGGPAPRGRNREAVRSPNGYRALARRWRTRGRRGHGLEVVARIAAEHGGRFMVRHGPGGTVAALELPLAAVPASALSAGAA